MKKILMNRKVQMCFFPIAFLCLLLVWLAAENEIKGWIIDFLLATGILFFILDRNFRPWTFYRLEKKEARSSKE